MCTMASFSAGTGFRRTISTSPNTSRLPSSPGIGSRFISPRLMEISTSSWINALSPPSCTPVGNHGNNAHRSGGLVQALLRWSPGLSVPEGSPPEHSRTTPRNAESAQEGSGWVSVRYFPPMSRRSASSLLLHPRPASAPSQRFLPLSGWSSSAAHRPLSSFR